MLLTGYKDPFLSPYRFLVRSGEDLDNLKPDLSLSIRYLLTEWRKVLNKSMASKKNF